MLNLKQQASRFQHQRHGTATACQKKHENRLATPPPEQLPAEVHRKNKPEFLQRPKLPNSNFSSTKNMQENELASVNSSNVGKVNYHRSGQIKEDTIDVVTEENLGDRKGSRSTKTSKTFKGGVANITNT